MVEGRKKILIIDDIQMNRTILGKAFNNWYDIVEAENGRDGLQQIQKNNKELVAIFLDIVMPEMDGFDVLQQMEHKEILRRIPVFIITTEISDAIIRRAYKFGVVDIIQKPFNLLIIERRVQNIIELYRNRNQLEKMFNDQIHTINDKNMELEESRWVIIEGLSSAIESRSAETGHHIRRICQLTSILLHDLVIHFPNYNIPENNIDLISKSAAMHDIGKISIPDHILNKPESEGRFTEAEFTIMKTHTTAGCKLLDSIEGIKNTKMYMYCYQICRSHHERWDGKGYPDGLKGNEIPISAQIVSIADVYDALVSKRVYKQPYPHETAVKMIDSGQCGQFNPDIMVCFHHTIDFIYKTYYENMQEVS